MTSNWKTKVRNSFDAKADRYNHNSELQANIADRLFNTLPELTDADILEIGCGTGTLSQKLINKYPDSALHITDISPNMIKEAQNNVQSSTRIHWSIMDGEALSTDKKYDLIVSNMAFQWFENPEKSLAKLYNYLKPSGRLVFTVPSNKSFKEWRSTLSELSLNHASLPKFKWPNIDNEEEIVIDYGTTLNFLRNLKEIGASVPANDYQMLKPSDIKIACSATDKKHNGKITWHILYSCLQKPQ